MAEGTVGEYLKQKRKARGFSEPMLSAITLPTGTKPIAVQSIRQIEQGKSVPKPDTLRRLAIALTGRNELTGEYVEVSYEHLLRLAGYLPEEEIFKALEPAFTAPHGAVITPVEEDLRVGPPPNDPGEIVRQIQELLAGRDAAIMVPELAQTASAGPGILEYAEGEYWPYLPAQAERGHRMVAVTVNGDCMEPRIQPGERVIVDLDGSPMQGDIVVAYHQGEYVVKELQLREGRWWLVALQHEEPLLVDDGTAVMGVVKMVMRRP